MEAKGVECWERTPIDRTEPNERSPRQFSCCVVRVLSGGVARVVEVEVRVCCYRGLCACMRVCVLVHGERVERDVGPLDAMVELHGCLHVCVCVRETRVSVCMSCVHMCVSDTCVECAFGVCVCLDTLR